MSTESQKKKITKEQAEKEYEAYLDFKKISSSKRLGKDKEELKNTVVNAIMDGLATIDQTTFEIKYSLCFPLADVSTLTFKPRLTKGDFRKATRGIASDDGEARVNAYISALTDEAKNVLNGLDAGTDYSFCESIVMYFL